MVKKIKVGFPGKYYTAKKKSFHKEGEYKMRSDSAVKLLKARQGWTYARTKDHNPQDRTVRSTDSPYSRGDPGEERLTSEDIDRIEEKVDRYDYRANVYPSKGKIEIWSNALGSWEFVHPDMRTKR